METVRCTHCNRLHYIDNFAPLTEDEDVCRVCAVDLYADEIVRLQAANSELLKTVLSKAATIEKLKAAGNHYPECKFHSWDWNFSWDKTDCSCPLD